MLLDGNAILENKTDVMCIPMLFNLSKLAKLTSSFSTIVESMIKSTETLQRAVEFALEFVQPRCWA